MQTIINRNLLRYSAGRAIFCPKCDTVADYRKWVIVEMPDGSIAGQCCTACFDTAQGGKPLPEGYTVIQHGNPAKAAKTPGHDNVPQKPGKALNTWLRSTIVKAHRYIKDNGRQIPGIAFGPARADWPMLERLTVDAEDNGTVHVDYAGDPVFSKLQINNYVAEFCRLNHLRGAA